MVEVQRATLTLAVPEQDASIFLSNNWIWQGENLHSTTGEVVDDAAADGNRAREARADDHEMGWWYGPYATDIPHGATYRVLFRLRGVSLTTTMTTMCCRISQSLIWM